MLKSFPEARPFSISCGVLLGWAAGCTLALATGNYLPATWLGDGGGKPVRFAPEFFWEIEVKRIAEEFKPVEKRIPSPEQKPVEGKANDNVIPSPDTVVFTASSDASDYQAALDSGKVSTADKKEALAIHRKARDIIANANEGTKDAALPVEVASEFADYHQGALGMKTGDAAVARVAWEKLLARPAAERKYRSTWATYMLAKLALDQKNYPQAIQLFQQTRELAKQGFADSLGLAADSYGWQARAELELGQAHQAAEHYLTQLALGDTSAVVSLKLLVPDRQAAVYQEVHDAAADATTKAAYQVDSTEKALALAAADPLLSRLVTAHVLALEPTDDSADKNQADSREARWLAALEKSRIKPVPDAENVGWISYSIGKYADAARWLKLSTGTTPMALWLKGKLALRDGKVDAAATSLSQALQGLKEPQELENSVTERDAGLPRDELAGELGLILLSKNDFVQALEVLLNSSYWADAGYVAERLLTTDELLDFTKKHFPLTSAPAKPKPPQSIDAEDTPSDNTSRFHSLVARRLVREDKYDLARPYFTEEMQKILDDYTAALKAAGNASSSKANRASAFFHAAWIARYDGMELMGTDGGPDGGTVAGDFALPNVAMARLTGKPHVDEDVQQVDAAEPLAFAIPVTPMEKKRLAATQLNPERRFHYRHVAAGLAWKAAELLPDNFEETADVLNTAGEWLRDRHEKASQRFMKAIIQRCPKTDIGKKVRKSGDFPDMMGPWSERELSLRDGKKPAKKAE